MVDYGLALQPREGLLTIQKYPSLSCSGFAGMGNIGAPRAVPNPRNIRAAPAKASLLSRRFMVMGLFNERPLGGIESVLQIPLSRFDVPFYEPVLQPIRMTDLAQVVVQGFSFQHF
jgi:hypothetical protein